MCDIFFVVFFYLFVKIHNTNKLIPEFNEFMCHKKEMKQVNILNLVFAKDGIFLQKTMNRIVLCMKGAYRCRSILLIFFFF